MFLVGFESTNLVVLLKQEKKTTGLNQSYSDLCFISFVSFGSSSYLMFRFLPRFLLFCYYPLNIVLFAIWRCTRKWEKGGIHHLNLHGKLWCWSSWSGVLLSSMSIMRYLTCQPYVCTLICRPCRSVNSILPLMVLCFVTAEHDLGAFYQPTSCSSGSYFWFLPCFH